MIAAIDRIASPHPARDPEDPSSSQYSSEPKFPRVNPKTPIPRPAVFHQLTGTRMLIARGRLRLQVPPEISAYKHK